MEIMSPEVEKIILKHVPPEHISTCVARGDTRLHAARTPVRVGSETLSMPFRGHLIFIDLTPEEKWEHPCLYLFINHNGHDVRPVRAELPPYDGEPPEEYVIIPLPSRPGIVD